jgi:coenzyme F420 hydrogenase subunit beta
MAPGPCVVVGQPSEITALRKAQKLRPGLDRRVRLAISFLCAGSPASGGTIDLLRSRGVAPEEVEELRYRGNGWPGHFAVRRCGEQQFTRLLAYAESWGFLQRHRPYSVHLFPDVSGEDADISCGDPWYRAVAEGEKGSSLVLVRTEAGRTALRAACEAGYLHAEPVKVESVLHSQKNLIRKRGAIGGRIATMRALGLPAPELKGFSLFRSWVRLSWMDKVRSVLGTARRAIGRGYRHTLRIAWERGVPVPEPICGESPYAEQVGNRADGAQSSRATLRLGR